MNTKINKQTHKHCYAMSDLHAANTVYSTEYKGGRGTEENEEESQRKLWKYTKTITPWTRHNDNGLIGILHNIWQQWCRHPSTRGSLPQLIHMKSVCAQRKHWWPIYGRKFSRKHDAINTQLNTCICFAAIYVKMQKGGLPWWPMTTRSVFDDKHLSV